MGEEELRRDVIRVNGEEKPIAMFYPTTRRGSDYGSSNALLFRLLQFFFMFAQCHCYDKDMILLQ